jgi:NAD-dependent SIR2 family protein deacetylase
MVTNYPQQLTANTGITPKETSGAGLMARMATRLGRAVCALHGHDAVLHFEGNRVMMRCTSCGHDTPGWEISGQGPRIRYEGDARRHILKPRLVLRKSA